MDSYIILWWAYYSMLASLATKVRFINASTDMIRERNRKHGEDMTKPNNMAESGLQPRERKWTVADDGKTGARFYTNRSFATHQWKQPFEIHHRKLWTLSIVIFCFFKGYILLFPLLVLLLKTLNASRRQSFQFVQ